MILYEITYKAGIFSRRIYRLFAIDENNARDLFAQFMPGKTITAINVSAVQAYKNAI